MVSEVDYIKTILRHLQEGEKIRLFANGISRSPIDAGFFAESVFSEIASVNAIGSMLLQPLFGDSPNSLLLVLTTKRLLIIATELDMMEFTLLDSRLIAELPINKIIGIQEKHHVLTRNLQIITHMGTSNFFFKGKKQCENSDKLADTIKQELIAQKTSSPIASQNTTNTHSSKAWLYSESAGREFVYLGSTKNKKFHRKNCKWVDNIATSSRICFSSIETAISYGYKPCKSCQPN